MVPTDFHPDATTELEESESECLKPNMRMYST